MPARGSIFEHIMSTIKTQLTLDFPRNTRLKPVIVSAPLNRQGNTIIVDAPTRQYFISDTQLDSVNNYFRGTPDLGAEFVFHGYCAVSGSRYLYCRVTARITAASN